MPSTSGNPRVFVSILPYLYGPLIGAGILALVFLVATGKQQLRQTQAKLDKIQVAQIASCEETNKVRRESNQHLRVPLKKAFQLASGGTPAEKAKQKVRIDAAVKQFQALAAKEKNKATKAILAFFVTALKGNPKLIQAYSDLGQQVTTVPLRNCQALAVSRET